MSRSAEAPSRPEAIARELRADILQGRFRPGERLPSERELAVRTGGSRGSAREALKRLEQQGLIRIQAGGARVAPLEQASLDVLAHLLEAPGKPDAALVAQCLDVREVLVVGAVRLAVERASEEELARAGELLLVLSSPTESRRATDRARDELMELVFSASRNLVLHMVRNGLRGIFAALLVDGRTPPLPSRDALAAVAGRLRAAFATRDAAAAEAATRELLRVTGERVRKRLEQSS
jgi:GntR family transcriptional repressor for pyruvate dehydrogenase complex